MARTHRLSDRSRKRLFTALRILVCAAALAWVLNGLTLGDYVTLNSGERLRIVEHSSAGVVALTPSGEQRMLSPAEIKIDEHGEPAVSLGLRSAWRNSDKLMLLATLLVFAPVTFIQSLRFLLVLRAQDIHLAYGESVKLCFAGNFLNFCTPLGSTGGDVFKAYHVARHTPHKTEAVTTILLDRIIGLAVLLLLVGTTMVLGARSPLLRTAGWSLVASVLGAGLLALAFVSERIRSRLLPTGMTFRTRFGEHVRRVDRAIRRLVRHVPSLSAAVLCTLLLQVLALSSFVLAAYALGMRFDGDKVFDYYACIGAGNVVAAVPISFQGLGTTEAVYRQFMLGSHGTLSQLLCMAMAIRLIHLLWALPGALVTLTGGYRLAPAAGAAL